MTKLIPGNHTIALNGIQLGYSIAGEGPVLFVTSPGWGIGSTYLQRGLSPLLKNFTIVFIDTRGSGHSTRPADKADMSSTIMADDIEMLRQHLALESIDLLGHSNGGAIGISYAHRYGKTCRKLVLVDSQLIGFPASEATGEIIGKVKDDPLYRDAVAQLAKPLPTTDEAFTQHLLSILPLFSHNPQTGVPRFTATMDGLVAQWAFYAQNAADALPAAHQTADLERIEADTLIMVGRHDWICPVAVSERLRAGIWRSKLAVFEKSGHWPWIEEPDQFFAEVTRFLLTSRD